MDTSVPARRHRSFKATCVFDHHRPRTGATPSHAADTHRQIIVKVREPMAKTISTAHPPSTVKDVAVMMRREDCGFVPIVRDDQLAGVVTDRDIVVRFCADGGGEANMLTTPIGEVMSATPTSVRADSSLEGAGHLMAINGVRRPPVLDGSRLVGVLSFGNLEQALHAHGACAEEVTPGVTVGA
jgi:CBS domain-containing protein